MEIKIEKFDPVTVISIGGKLDGNTASQAQQKILPTIAQGLKFVLDLSRCSYVSSAGLRVLLLVAKTLAPKKGKVVLTGLSEEIRSVIEMTGFNNIFQEYPSVTAAVEALKA